MNISKEQIDELNAVITVDIAKEDYSTTVESVLNDYRKKSNVPGFRKGRVPMGLVKKQYGKAVLADEVNKLLQDSLNKYLLDEQLDVLGNPLPKVQDDFDWDSENYSFEFELGLAPKFEVQLEGKNAITYYKISPTKEMVSEQIINMQKQYGKLISKEVAEAGDVVKGTFSNEERALQKEAILELDTLKGETNLNKFLGTKVGDIITVNTKGLFKEDRLLVSTLGIAHEETEALDIEVTFTVSEVNQQELAELNQEFFDKLYGEGQIKTAEELEKRVHEDAEKQFVQYADQHLLNEITESLLENTKFELPAAFLQKWIQSSADKALTPEAAKEEYEKSEKGLRFQLIEGKIINDNNLQVTFEELKAHAKELIKGQMAQFGQLNPEDKELEDIAARILGNQEEARRISDQLMSQKMLTYFKENLKLKVKEISFEDFIKESSK